MPNLPNLLAKRICLPAHPPIVRLTEDRRAGHGEFVATTQLIPQKPLHRGDYGLFWVVMRGPLPHQAGESGLQRWGISKGAGIARRGKNGPIRPRKKESRSLARGLIRQKSGKNTSALATWRFSRGPRDGSFTMTSRRDWPTSASACWRERLTAWQPGPYAPAWPARPGVLQCRAAGRGRRKAVN